MNVLRGHGRCLVLRYNLGGCSCEFFVREQVSDHLGFLLHAAVGLIYVIFEIGIYIYELLLHILTDFGNTNLIFNQSGYAIFFISDVPIHVSKTRNMGNGSFIARGTRR